MNKSQIENNKPKRTFFEKYKIHHKVNKRSGLYSFIFKSFLKLVLILIGIIALILLLNEALIASGIDMKLYVENLIEKTDSTLVFIIFFISESFLGWIPPDFFIVWAEYKPTAHTYLNVTFLATLSYFGGYVAYYIGILIRKFPRVDIYIRKKNALYFHQIRKWGGFVIVMASLFPLPFATTSTVAGVVKYPFKYFVLYGLTRYIRFYAYAASIFWGIDNLL